MLPFLEAIQPDLERVNATIIKELHSDEPLVEDIGQHLINAGGKRLRPILALMVAKSLGYNGPHDTHIAAIIEFIHTATLLHDDVVDVSELRRGLPTANATWGNAPSVLVGDFLYSRAFQMMVAIGDMNIMQVLANTTNVIAEGEVQQLANAKKPDISEQQYLSVIYKKTAALFEAACQCGAIPATENQDTQLACRRFGYHLGLAFQLMDDLLDYAGDTDTLGKNVGDDLAEGKATLPLIVARTRCEQSEKAIIDNAISQPNADSITEVMSIVSKYDGISYTRTMAEKHAEQAAGELESLPNNVWTDRLAGLSEFAVKRSH